MIRSLKDLFTKNIGLKIAALILALICWFYIVKELNKGTEEEQQFLRRILPTEGISSKKLTIKPIFVGKLRSGYRVIRDQVIVVPEYCIVVGTRDLLGKVRYAYTIPLDVGGASKTFTRSVPLNPIAPGVFMEETLVQVTVPIEKE
ncbi:MAG: YbbR-like domain-containing protein [Candidatus Omnitrophota bacterium]